MTVKSIEEQISTIREATETALTSPEAALEFLQRAGIVAPNKNKVGKQIADSIGKDSISKTK
jgi:hypothetical protein